MLFNFRCNATFPSQNQVEAHFDMPGTRPLILSVPLPGPTVGEMYAVEVSGTGIPASPSPNQTPAADEVAKWQHAAVDAQSERDLLRAELEQIRSVISPPVNPPANPPVPADPLPAVLEHVPSQEGEAAAHQQNAGGDVQPGSEQSS